MDRYIIETASNEKRYKCPYCEDRVTRKAMCHHIETKHEELIPQGQTPLQVAFNSVNKKTDIYGRCVMCGGKTLWNEDKGRYERRCGSKKCHDDYVKLCEDRLKKSYGKTKQEMLSDPDFQNKMLQHRTISGTYKFSDGGKISYVGSYEKNFLEFLDKVLKVDSVDIQAPGPSIPYTYKGKQHFWITDSIYIPYNLVFDIKDGGANPNKRDMVEYREKQIAKEKAIAELGKYNYCRLTDNNFSQLLAIMMELKESLMDLDNPITMGNISPIIRINESFLLEGKTKRSNLKDSVFGLPHKRKYPMIDKKHTLSAIKFFNYVDKEDEEELAKNIKRNMKKYNISPLSIGKNNRLREYVLDSTVSESVVYDAADHDAVGLSPLIPLKVNTLIFDIGDVLTTFNPESAMINSGIPKEYAKIILAIYYNSIESSELETASHDECISIIKAKLEDHIKKYASVAYNCMVNCTMPFEYTEELLTHFKDKGYRLYYLSNWNKDGVEICKSNGIFDFLKYFDGGLFSYEVELMKPDERIYSMLLTKYSIDPSEAMFFDDKEENIIAAVDVGLNGWVFRPGNADLLLKEDRIAQTIVSELGGQAGTSAVIGGAGSPGNVYVINRMVNNVFAGSIGYGDGDISSLSRAFENEDHDTINEEISEGYAIVYKSLSDTIYETVSSILEAIYTGVYPRDKFERVYTEVCDTFDAVREITESSTEARIRRQYEKSLQTVYESNILTGNENQDSAVNYKYHRDINGYYIENNITLLRSKSREGLNFPSEVVKLIQKGFC